MRESGALLKKAADTLRALKSEVTNLREENAQMHEKLADMQRREDAEALVQKFIEDAQVSPAERKEIIDKLLSSKKDVAAIKEAYELLHADSTFGSLHEDAASGLSPREEFEAFLMS